MDCRGKPSPFYQATENQGKIWTACHAKPILVTACKHVVGYRLWGRGMAAFKAMAFGTTLAFSATVGTLSTTQAGDGCTGSYRIVEGDTLLDISRSQLGSVFVVEKLIAANQSVIGHDPDLIFAGDALTIPCEAAVSRPMDWSVMSDAHTLAGLLRSDNVQVLDIRAHRDVDNGVIPGAIHVPFSAWDTTENRPSEALISDIIGLSGVQLQHPIIIVNSNASLVDMKQAATIFAILQAVGAEHVAILQDGYRSWVNADLPVVAFPALKDPYDVTLMYQADLSDDPFAAIDHASAHSDGSFWREVGHAPDVKSGFDASRLTSLLFARAAGD